MEVSRRAVLKGSLAALFAFQAVTQAQAKSASVGDPDLHLLSRLSWGVLPEDLERLKAVGQEAYLNEQLNPETLDDPEADTRMARHPILSMDRRTIYGLQNGNYRAYKSLVIGMIDRAVHSKRQLQERMVEFWTDHFNIPTDFDNVPDIVVWHAQVRKHALGKFRDLLFASAKAPAMLYYLDNASSTAEAPNENYARELLELHTVGVDGGYSEADVKDVAKAFTGWKIHNATRTGFYFDDYHHDASEKHVLGHTLAADRGIEDGLQVLSILASHPSTAQFVCRKLCVRFVRDDPSKSLVDSLATVWQETDGDIKAVLSELFLSEEFIASAGLKFRRPLEFFVGLTRATGTEIYEWWNLEDTLQALGQVPYDWHPPDGYPDVAGAWMNTNGLLSRWNVAMYLTHGAYSDGDAGWGSHTELRQRIPDVATAEELLAEVSKQVFGTVLAKEALEPFLEYLTDGAGGLEPVTPHLLSRKLGSLYGLMLASPQYQWR